jgi:hypothetical protein
MGESRKGVGVDKVTSANKFEKETEIETDPDGRHFGFRALYSDFIWFEF